ncbi:GPP34 family phosphoprotein [Streptomyces sp. NRRL F-5135]|uniref:GPP34 family phosphoprotein n=1 Tax=Streptomyces sp. NRRL F-5135 TaxID=1463858 RepID=UPI0004C5954E|nr:GPP34 family phosphoprotein [Streptomyces sp. NRRL F-5135]
MTTPRDLMFVALDAATGNADDMETSRPLEWGDVSLALAGAELIDLLGVEAVRLDEDRLVPGMRPALADHLLDEAASSLVRQTPYESVDDWLWRRGRGLATAYPTALEAEGQLTRRRRRLPLRTGRTVPADSAAHRRAADRWAAHDPVLTALAAAAGIGDPHATAPPDVADDAVATVLAAVNDAVRELEAVRQRRAIERAAFDNIWRGDGQ